MRTWMITWKPSEWPELPQRGEALRQGGEFVESWKFALRNDQPQKGDRVFLKRTQDNGEKSGEWPNGIVAAGHIDKDGIYDDGDPGEAPTPHALIRFDWVQEDLSDVLPIQSLKDAFPDFKNWEPRNSGSAVTVDAYELELMWAKKIGVEHDFLNLVRAFPTIDPLTHDPAYELTSKAISLYEDHGTSDVGFADIDFIYMMSHIITEEGRKKYLSRTCLSDQEKSEMEALLDECARKVSAGGYGNHNPEENYGLFAKGFSTFDKNGADANLPKRLIDLMIEIKNAPSAEAAVDAIESSGVLELTGIAAGSFSEMVHCLRPSELPIANGHEGLPPIWPSLIPGTKKNLNKTSDYAKLCRSAQELRRDQFPEKGFREVDLAQRLLDGGSNPPAIQAAVPEVPIWLVFQSASYENERDASYISSRKTGKKGKPIPWHWKTMEEVRPGDFIFHVSNQKLMAVSRATGSIRYDATNQYVDCGYHEFQNPVALAKFRSLIIQERQGRKNFPFDRNGFGNQIYLARLPLSLAKPFAQDARDTNPGMDTSFLDPILNGTAYQSGPQQGGAIMASSKKIGLNTILYGPPGTGKTYNAVVWAVAICEQGSKTLADVEAEAAADYGAVKARYDQYLKDGRIAFTTFHQSYAYEDFIEGIKPKTVDNAGKKEVVYPTLPGSFRRFCEKAKPAEGEEPRPCVFIIDEINRGNISKIFGELITLIEPSKREGAPEAMSAKLPYSGKDFSVPLNVYILGTMNTADRSIALMDTALRRRFSFEEMMPDANVLRNLGIDKVTAGGKTLDVAAMLEAMNRRIEALYDREHTLGHALFMRLNGSCDLETLASVFEDSIVPLLQEYFYEDYEKIQLVLGDNAKDDAHKFVKDIANDSSIFKGSADVQLPEKRYEVNLSAFYNIDSYIGII